MAVTVAMAASDSRVHVAQKKSVLEKEDGGGEDCSQQ